jgi:4-azaleucine resistance transporter AzlC
VTVNRPAPDLRSELVAAMARASPIATGYFAVSWVFGLAAAQAGYPPWLPIAMCVFVYAGASQFAALALLGAHATVTEIVVTTFLVNLRHVLMSVSVAPPIAALGSSRRARWIYGFGLTDECFSMHCGPLQRGEVGRLRPLIVFNCICHASWIAGAVAGVLTARAAGRFVPVDLSYALTAMMLYVLVSLCTNRQRFAVAGVSVLIALLSALVAPSVVSLFVAVLAACGAGSWMRTRDSR